MTRGHAFYRSPSTEGTEVLQQKAPSRSTWPTATRHDNGRVTTRRTEFRPYDNSTLCNRTETPHKKFDFSFPLATDIMANNNPGHLPDAYNNSLNEGKNSFLHSELDEIRTIPETEIANYLDTFETSLKKKLQESCPWIAFENEKIDT